ncbi:hypothetical protein MW290_24630 [Aquincola tertiaricarbonis]|uniref:Uncharacterized protein n=1 Tax=Aquincola tertiaricarbonis TaxID=391953 RepID=A0ABY4SCJ5_AQUTE|nr:hypothetical protein [Aquincola tertiaricarbonis]URI08766.1 hypothetical protein MW290_24630 [Aquincola tertiaricarbonis]
MPCALCGSWEYNRSSCSLERGLKRADDLLNLIELGEALDAPPDLPPDRQEEPCP